MNNAMPYFISAVFVLAGLLRVLSPRTMWEWEEKPTDDRIAPSATALRKARLAGFLLLALGLIALGFCLFGEPAKYPLLF